MVECLLGVIARIRWPGTEFIFELADFGSSTPKTKVRGLPNPLQGHVTHAGYHPRYTSQKASYLQTSSVVDTGKRTVSDKIRFINPRPPLPKVKQTGWVTISLVSRVSSCLEGLW